MVTDRHWNMWALDQIEQAGGKSYPSSSPFYTPPALGNVMSEPVDNPTDEDWLIARRIGNGVRALGQDDKAAERLLIEWYGAYPGAHSHRKQRLMKLELNPNRAREMVREKQQYVQGWVSARYSELDATGSFR